MCVAKHDACPRVVKVDVVNPCGVGGLPRSRIGPGAFVCSYEMGGVKKCHRGGIARVFPGLDGDVRFRNASISQLVAAVLDVESGTLEKMFLDNPVG